MIEIDLFNRTNYSIPRAIFTRLCVNTLRVLVREGRVTSKQKFRVEVSLLGSAAITMLNRRHHAKNSLTDVISLSYFDEKMDDNFVGEIFMCVPFAQTQAKKIGQSLHEELRFLFVHGLLHIFGYDHTKPREEAAMKKLTYEILGRMRV